MQCDTSMAAVGNISKMGCCSHCFSFLGDSKLPSEIKKDNLNEPESLQIAAVIADLIINARGISQLTREKFIFGQSIRLNFLLNETFNEGITPYENLKKWTRYIE